MTDQQLQTLVEELSLRYFKRAFVHRAYFNRRLKTTGGRYLLTSHDVEINEKMLTEHGRPLSERSNMSYVTPSAFDRARISAPGSGFQAIIASGRWLTVCSGQYEELSLHIQLSKLRAKISAPTPDRY